MEWFFGCSWYFFSAKKIKKGILQNNKKIAFP